jgi:hypothetical protein
MGVGTCNCGYISILVADPQSRYMLFCKVIYIHASMTAVTKPGYRDTGVVAIEKLMERRGKFDYILLETTGLADPGNIAPLFWLDEGLGSSISLDGIVTLVDAVNIVRTLEDQTALLGNEEAGARPTTAHLQISHADVVVINKADLVTEQQIEVLKQRIAGINGLAKILVTERGRVDNLEEWLLDLKAYEDVGGLTATVGAHLDEVCCFLRCPKSLPVFGRTIMLTIEDHRNCFASTPGSGR